MEPRLVDLVGVGQPDDEVALLLAVRDGGVLPPNVRVVTRFGNVMTCRARRDRVTALRAEEVTQSLKAPARILPDLDEPFEDTFSNQQRTERPALPDDLTGRGVVVGVVDWGADFTHPDFRRADGSSRLLGLWDQRSSPQRAGAPRPYGYGSAYDTAQIERALGTTSPFSALGYDPTESDGGSGTHGTHTLGIAAGNGRAGGPRGIAPAADLVFVHLAPWRDERDLRLADSVTLLEAIDYVFRLAGSRPCVVNLSLGAHAGPHDGTTLMEQALDAALLERPGRAIVQSVGNYHDKRVHAGGRLGPGQQRTLRLEVEPLDATANEIDIWYSGRDRLDVELRAPGGESSGVLRLGERGRLVVDGVLAARVHHRASEPNSQDHNIRIVIELGAPTGQWQVTLSAVDVVDGSFDAWIERDDGPGNQARFCMEDAIATRTSGTICNGYRTIVVGAYDGHATELAVAPFSGGGPTRNVPRRKPDLVAPGVRVLSARSASPGSTEQYVRKSGTSMASPCVAGTVALMFEAAGRALSIQETRLALLSTVRPASVDADRVGGGVLDVLAAADAARAVANGAVIGTEPLPGEVDAPAEAYDGDIHGDERLETSLFRNDG